MKGFTDLDQSRKLAEFLPIESADMWYHGHGSPWESEREYDSDACPFHSMRPNWDIPCWSLAALFKVISDIFKYNLDYNGTSFILMVGDFEVSNKAAVDACVEMIEKLHEQKLL